MSVDHFSVWAPRAERVTLVADGKQYEMGRDPEDWWRAMISPPADEIDYGFLIDDAEDPIPDPRSRRQPYGVHGLSRLFHSDSHEWGDGAWTGKQLAGSIIYEMHVGTFTQGGTLTSAVERLDHLVELGVDFVELLPVNGFNGDHGWGYDGVLWFTVHEAYGGPAAYQEFVDQCHQRGLGVLQDVVYNHLGPSGNILPRLGPYQHEGAANPWGESLNLDGEDSDEVRRYIIDNALMWLNDYHVDGLRLDAVHALVDSRAIDILEEIATETDALSAHLRRPLSLIAESDLNNPRLITPREGGGYGLAAQWSDDFHHAVLANLAGEDSGYYADFASLEALGKVMENGFFHDGTISTFRGRRHGRSLDRTRTAAWRLVVCSDNHDQIGNRADGARLRSTLSDDQLVIAAALTLLGPGTPMIFMGEEWGASTPWAFFTSHPEPELAEAVSKGRLEEFAKMDWDTSLVPDPQAESTFTDSILRWGEVDQAPYSTLLGAYRTLIELRRTHEEFTDPRMDWVSVDYHEDESWFMVQRNDRAIVAVNFGAEPAVIDVSGVRELIYSNGATSVEESKVRLGAHATAVFLVDPFDPERA